MQALELSPRLAAIAAQVPSGDRLADVGTDHAYLPAFLLLEGKIAGAVATDVNQGPLLRGRESARTYGVEEKIDFRLCDGLADVSAGEVDTVVIAGMGGELIARILDAAPWTKRALLLLQPMSSQSELRKWLTEHGYSIRRERVVKEGTTYYVILTVTGGESEPYTQAELWAGRQKEGEKDPYRLEYLENLIHRRKRALEGMRQGSTLSPEKLQEEEALLRGLEQLREEWSKWQL